MGVSILVRQYFDNWNKGYDGCETILFIIAVVFTMGVLALIKQHLYIDTDPWVWTNYNHSMDK